MKNNDRKNITWMDRNDAFKKKFETIIETDLIICVRVVLAWAPVCDSEVQLLTRWHDGDLAGLGRAGWRGDNY